MVYFTGDIHDFPWNVHKFCKKLKLGEEFRAFRKLTNLRFYRHSGLLFRHELVLSFAEAVPVAPGHVVFSKQGTHVRREDVQCISVAGDACALSGIIARNTKTATFIVDEAVKGYLMPGLNEDT